MRPARSRQDWVGYTRPSQYDARLSTGQDVSVRVFRPAADRAVTAFNEQGIAELMCSVMIGGELGVESA